MLTAGEGTAPGVALTAALVHVARVILQMGTPRTPTSISASGGGERAGSWWTVRSPLPVCLKAAASRENETTRKCDQ